MNLLIDDKDLNRETASQKQTRQILDVRDRLLFGRQRYGLFAGASNSHLHPNAQPPRV